MGGMKRLLLLLWVGAAVSTAVDLQKRIIGGQPCNRPYHVQITDDSGNFVCGGSMLENGWILTAAHCWQWHLNAVLTGQQRIRITTPPVMYSDNNNTLHDIMLLQLQLPPQVQAQHAWLPNCNQRPNMGNPVEVAGHGSYKTKLTIDFRPFPHVAYKRASRESQVLRCAQFDLVDCGTPDPEYPHLICGRRARVDTSPGDSGGGVEWNGMIYGVHVLGGVRPFTISSAFMDVCEYLPWIQQTTGIRAVG